VVVVEQLERQALADRQALIGRGLVEELPTVFTAQQHFDEWLVSEQKSAQAMTPEQLARHEELVAMGVA